MARPKSKPELQEAAATQFDKLWTVIDSMSADEQQATFPEEDRDRNLRDVLAHLYEWQQMTHAWYTVGTLEGGMPEVPGPGFTWRTIPELNRQIHARYQEISLDDISQKLREGHALIVSDIDAHTNEELFDRGVYTWTKTSTLGAYFIGATSSHYDWAMKKLRKQVKLMRAGS